MYTIYMPTVAEYQGLKLKIHAKDHNPPHVHVEKKGYEARIELNNLEILSVNGFSQNDMKKIIKLVSQYKEELMEAWNEYHE